MKVPKVSHIGKTQAQDKEKSAQKEVDLISLFTEETDEE
jgi:hypothetical protein